MRVFPKVAKRSTKVIMTAAGCATLLGLAVPATAMAATGPDTVHPMSGDSCNLDYVAQECTAVVGSGLHITSISGTFKATQPEYGIAITFYGPNGYITKTATYNITGSHGGTLGPFVWHNPNPNANMTAGDYCTQPTGLPADCIDVHS